MLISYAWLTELLGADPGLDRVVERLTLGGLEVEHVERVGQHLRDVVIARMVSTRPHPKSRNPLTLVTVDDGSQQLEVVCGAPNVPPPGGLVCLARLGATVFDDDGRPFTLEARPVAGIESRGMLCAEDELGLGDGHAGILVLDEGTPGVSLGDIPGLVDTVLTLNVTPNRGDALSHYGVARDVAALIGIEFSPAPAPAAMASLDARASELVTVAVDDPDRCPRYVAAVLKGVTVKPSPLWARVRLHRLGVRAINNLVDVTNLVMLETGQPLHAFDRDRVGGASITVRVARAGEVMRTLDGVDRALVEGDVVIADADGAVALAGVMGGERSGIGEQTRDVILECAAFDPRAVRRTARRLGMHTESSHRFERGVDVEALPSVAQRAASLLTRLGGGAQAQGLVDVYPAPQGRRRVTMRLARAASLLGVAVTRDEAARSLRALGFEVADGDGDELVGAVPPFRNDVAREVDLIEEVARVRGIDRIAPTLPPTRGARAGVTRDFKLRRKLRETLASLGLDEAIFTLFASPAEIEAAGMDPSTAVPLANPLSAERGLLRPSLVPRLIAAIGRARRHGEARVRLFELASVFSRSADPTEPLPDERTRVAVAMAGPRDAWLAKPDDVDFYDLKGVVQELCERMTGETPTLHADGEPPPWAHPRAFAHVRLGGKDIGAMGALHPDVVERADLGRTAMLADLDAEALGLTLKRSVAKVPPRFPAVRRDVSLRVAKSVPAGALIEGLRAGAGELCEDVALFDRFAGGDLAPTEHALAFALTFRAGDRSLNDAEVDARFEAAVAAVCEAHGATRR